MKRLISVVLMCLVVVGWTGSRVARSADPADLLTVAEREWLDAHPEIVLGVGEEWAPWVVRRADGGVSGFAVDHLRLLGRKLGVDIRLEAGPWHRIVARAQAGELDGLTLSAPLPERQDRFLFTDAFHTVHDFVYLRTGEPLPNPTLEGLAGKRVGYLEGVLRIGRLLAGQPGIEAVALDGLPALAQALLAGDIDVVIGSYALEHWRSTHDVYGFTAMRILLAGQPSLVISVRRDWPELIPILNKGLAAIMEEEMAVLYRRWFGEDYLRRVASVDARLSADERAWIAAHPRIVAGFAVNQPPAIIVGEDGRPSGLLVDYIDLLNQRLGTNIRLELADWPTVVQRGIDREIDFIGFTFALETHRRHFDFTAPVLKTYYYIYARADEPNPVADLDGLAGRRIGYIAATRMVEETLGGRGDIELVPLPNPQALADALLASRVDVVVANVSLEYWRKQHIQTGFRIVALVPEMGGDLVMSVRKDWPELTRILDKGLATITTEERQAILNRWVGSGLPLAPGEPALQLTAEEKAWLRRHPVLKASIDSGWAPVEFADRDGLPQGISRAYLRRLGELLGVKFEVTTGPTWGEAMRRLEEGTIDLLPAMAVTPERQQRIRFTEPYLSFPAAILSAADVAYLGGIEALEGKRVAVVQGEATQAWLESDYPQLELVPVATTKEALIKLAEGDAFAFVGNLVTTSYYIGQSGLTQIKVAGETPYAYRLAMAVPGDAAMLAGILQKALMAIPKHERDAIYNDWISIRYEHHIDYALLWQVFVVAAVIVLVVISWNRRLAYEVTKRRRAEAALREAKDAAEQASRAKSAFLAHMSHELRTPLNAVLGFASLLQGTEQNEKNRGYLNAISVAGKGLLQLIDDVLDLSRIEAGKLDLHPRPLELQGLLQDLELMFSGRAAEKGVTSSMRMDAGVPGTLLLDEVRLRQILVNLIGNAVKFTDAGRIEVRVSAQPLDADAFRLELAVADTGTGIPPEQQQEIFELFGQRPEQDSARYGGTGLGLGISRRLAGLMGGEIRLESEPGHGSTFTLVLPRVASVKPFPEASVASASAGLVMLGPARVLVADDNPLSRRLLVEYLTPYGLEITEAEDGAQALKQARSGRPDLILLDIAMPVMNGFEVARLLKADPGTAAIPVIAVTASAMPDREAEAQAVCDAFLTKPLARAELLAVVQRFLPPSPAGRAALATAPDRAETPALPPMCLPAALYEQLHRLRPPFVSINELEAFARALESEGERRGDGALREAGGRLRQRAQDFDMPALRRDIEEMQAVVAAEGSPAEASAPAGRCVPQN